MSDPEDAQHCEEQILSNGSSGSSPLSGDAEAVMKAAVDAEAEAEAEAEADVPHLEEQETLEETEASTMADAGAGNVADPDAAVVALADGELLEADSQDASSIDAAPNNATNSIDFAAMAPVGSPSIQGSHLSSPSASILPLAASRPRFSSPTPSFRPFDRRFQSRISSSNILSPRPSSPAPFYNRARDGSFSSSFVLDQSHIDTDTPSPPWEVVRWTRLKKLGGRIFSEQGKRNFGSPTCLAVSTHIALGTTKGIILVFDYNQNLKVIIGPGTKAVESGPVTALAISADHTTIAGGHANGNIFTWDISRASKPFLLIPHLEWTQLRDRTVDGHMPDIPVVHLGFLGTRHTALVSADKRGMAFSHLASRGTGSLGRTVTTTRILGRYPNAPAQAGKSIKPSTVFAFAPLPLGNIERATDTMGLTAMLTPYLLVIVSTTPIAQTQHKSARPKDVPAHSAMTGCLAWFPAVKLKTADSHTGSLISKAKLVYCWSNVLTVLDVDEIPDDDRDYMGSLKFKARSRWKCEESIAAVQWISRSVLAVLTISQRLIVLEDRSMRMTEAFDLLDRYIYHSDLFSHQLHNLVEQLDESDVSMHGVVADAFYMGFKTYKGRMFLLGFNDVCIGALSNWADRLIATMEHGDYIGAIQLATSYYTGDANRLTVGLPDDAVIRHGMVRDKIMEIMGASLKYAFSRRRQNQSSVNDEHLKQLVEACFIACQSIEEIDYLFEELYDWYSDAGLESIFLETLEPHILDKTIIVVPPTVVKDMVSHYVTMGWEGRLEEMICQMETGTLDLDQITLLCKQHNLYDAFTYVWNQALQDYITPMIDLLSLLVPLMSNGELMASNAGDDFYSINAVKIFPYLSYTLTGRVYPSGEMMDEEMAHRAKAEIYWFFFCGKTVSWPKGSDREFLTRADGGLEPAFPYLRMILKFDAPSFLSALNEAFEDPFLNDSPDKHAIGNLDSGTSEEQIFGSTINRQYILSILLDVMNPNDFTPADSIYLDMFVARNLPKFPQYLLLSGSTLSKVLVGLCNYPGVELAEEAQLSTEYLLSVYHPSDMPLLMPLFKEAGFHRILKRVYKADKQYARLLETYLEDPEDQEFTFDCIADCLRPNSGLNARQRQEVRSVIEQHARDLLELNPERSASTLASEDMDLHRHVLDSAEDAPELQHAYLKTLLEPEEPVQDMQEGFDRNLIEQYVRLMCKFEPQHASDYIGSIQSVDLRIDQLLPTMEETGVIDAAVTLLAQDGQVQGAMERLIKHLGTLESALQGLLNSRHGDEGSLSIQSSAEALLEGLQKFVYVGIWLCQGQTKSSRKVNVVTKKGVAPENGLSEDEALWLSLIDACVQVTRRLSPAIHSIADDRALDEEKLLAILRSLVQHTFTSLLLTTSSPANGQMDSRVASNAGSNLSFLRILRAFLTQAAVSLPNLADLRAVLASIFSAYAYEESILRLSNRLLEGSLFTSVGRLVELRQRGWRPRGSACEACGKRVWGPGVAGGAVYKAWEDRKAIEDAAMRERKSLNAERAKGNVGESDKRAKGKNLDTRPSSMLLEPDSQDSGKDQQLGPLVVLACRHIYHQSCLDSLQAKQENGIVGREREYRCAVDG